MEKMIIGMSPEGREFREHITELLTKEFLSEKKHTDTLRYLDTDAENLKFSNKDTEAILELFKIEERKCGFQVDELDGNKVFTFDPEESSGPIFMYIHGGAYVFGYTDIYYRYNEAVAVTCGAKVVSPVYELANGHRRNIAEKVYGHLMKVYLALISEGRPVFLMGDSSGGAMALRLWQLIRERSVAPPSGLILLSPFVDAAFEVPIEQDLAQRDITLDRFGLEGLVKLWSGEAHTGDPVVNPLKGTMEGIPRTLIVAGTDEIFLPSNEALAERIDKAGGQVTLVECEGSYHIFPVYTHLPESVSVMEIVRRFCNATD